MIAGFGSGAPIERVPNSIRNCVPLESVRGVPHPCNASFSPRSEAGYLVQLEWKLSGPTPKASPLKVVRPLRLGPQRFLGHVDRLSFQSPFGQ